MGTSANRRTFANRPALPLSCSMTPPAVFGLRGAGNCWPMGDYTKVSLDDIEDAAISGGFSEVQEARFPRRDLGAEQTGLPTCA